ncbi:MAG TPA: TetR/AcrR family transcriptional regulator [Ignavibacteriaceae bacterium]|nr:TetR/AcrR family transcriptional regulator [Ignavibacteriaceae bacterium]
MRTKEGNKEKDILDAAVEIFANDGFHKSKISKIATLANVATGSIYLYFENKEHILLRIFEKLWSNIYKEAEALNQSKLDPVEKIEKLVDLFFSYFNENPRLALVYVKEQDNINLKGTLFYTYHEGFLDIGEDIFNQGIQQGKFNKNINVKVLRHFIFGGSRNLLHLWAEDSSFHQLNSIGQSVKNLIKNGILL